MLVNRGLENPLFVLLHDNQVIGCPESLRDGREFLMVVYERHLIDSLPDELAETFFIVDIGSDVG